MLGCVGDLVEDIAVQLGGPVNLASDTEVVASRQRGGSAANVAVAAARIAGRARFIGSIGDDRLGDALALELDEAGVEVIARRGGRSGTVVVLVDDAGERTMLTDRGSSADLVDPEPAWLDGLKALHVPFYSLAQEPLATTTSTLINWARARSIMVSLDVSSTAVVKAYGLAAFHDLLTKLEPHIVFANDAEAELIGVGETVTRLTDPSAELVVHGPTVATVHAHSGPIEVAAHDLGFVVDTTGAGDAFAAGYLTAKVAGAAPRDAARLGHQAARAHLTARAG